MAAFGTADTAAGQCGVCGDGHWQTENRIYQVYVTEPKHLLIPDRDLTTDQSTDTTKVQFCEPVSCIGTGVREVNRNDSKAVYHQDLPQHG